MYDMLKSKTAIVTGAAQGIGKAIAARFLEEGASVVLCDIDGEKVKNAALELDASGAKTLGVKTDVTKKSDVQAVVDATLEKFKSKTNTWALAESLLVDGESLICCPGGPQTSMVALNKNTGSVIWTAPSTGDLAGNSSPILVEYQQMRIIIALTAKNIIGVNADTGGMLWHLKHESYADENVMTPIFFDGQLFISTLKAGSVKWKINVKDGKVSLEELWRTQELDCHHGGVILLDGNLHGNSTFRNSKLWVCLDWQTGKNKYMDKGVGKGSLTFADGMLYTLSENRMMGLVRPTAVGYELVSSFNIPEGGKGNSWAHPVVCGGRLYIRHDEFLYVYKLR